MHAAFQIDLLLRSIRGKLGSRYNGPHVRHIHRFLINACQLPKDKLEHPDFLGSSVNWNALDWTCRPAGFSTIIDLGISHWLVCPTPHTMTPQTADTGQTPSPAHDFTQCWTKCKAMYLTTFFFSQQWDRACGKRFPHTKPDWIPSIDDRSGHFCMDHLSRYKTLEPSVPIYPIPPWRCNLKVQVHTPWPPNSVLPNPGTSPRRNGRSIAKFWHGLTVVTTTSATHRGQVHTHRPSPRSSRIGFPGLGILNLHKYSHTGIYSQHVIMNTSLGCISR